MIWSRMYYFMGFYSKKCKYCKNKENRTNRFTMKRMNNFTLMLNFNVMVITQWFHQSRELLLKKVVFKITPGSFRI